MTIEELLDRLETETLEFGCCHIGAAEYVVMGPYMRNHPLEVVMRQTDFSRGPVQLSYLALDKIRERIIDYTARMVARKLI